MSDMRKEGEDQGQSGDPLVQRYAAQWEASSGPPDIESFLQNAKYTSPAQFTDLVRFDQVERAKLGQLLPVEHYFGINVGWSIDDDCKVALITSDFACRGQAGEDSTVEQYLQRFPTLADHLSRVLPSGRPADDLVNERTAIFHNDQSPDSRSEVSAEFELETDSGGADEGTVPIVGRYEIVRSLGRGSFGQVYLARDSELGRSVAIKIAHQDRIRSEEDRETYLKEARMLASLDHPAILPVHDVGRTEDGRRICCVR